jgi:hypothetical protein
MVVQMNVLKLLLGNGNYPVTKELIVFIIAGAAIIILWLWHESREPPEERIFDAGE